MAELATLPNLGFTIPQTTTVFNPTWTAPTYKPEDFEAALNFAPKPIAPNTFTPELDQLGSTLDKIASPQFQLSNALSKGALNAYNTPLIAPVGQAPAPAANTPNPTGYSAPAAAPVASGPTPAVQASQVGAVPNATPPDANGFHMTLGTTFGTPSDLADFAKHKSLATGDNGVGAWGDDTTGSTPFVALPPSTLKAYGIDPNTARGTPVTLMANGKTVQAVVGDKMPDNSSNGAGIDMNPATATGLGISDVNNFKGPVSFKLGHDDNSSAAPLSVDTSVAATPTASGTPSMGMLAATLPAAADPAPVVLAPPTPAPVANTPLFGFQPNVAPNGNLPTLGLPSASGASGTAAADAVANGPMVAVGSDTSSAPPPPTVARGAAPPAPSAVNLAPPSSAPATPSKVNLMPPPQPAATTPTPMLMPPAPLQSEFQQRLTNAFGAGHPIISPTGNVEYDTIAPLNPLQQAEVNLMPHKAKLEDQQLALEQQKFDLQNKMAPLTIQAEQAKIALQQRQFEAAQQAAQNGKPIVVPDPSGTPAGGITAAPNPETPFTPGHILFPLTVTTVKDGVPQDVENQALSSALNVAGSHGAKVNEHMTMIGGRPYVDMTSLYAASGADAQSMREQTAQFGQKYLMAQSAADAAKAYLNPNTPKNGAGDTQFINSVLQTEAPGTVPNGDARKQIAERQGWGIGMTPRSTNSPQCTTRRTCRISSVRIWPAPPKPPRRPRPMNT